MNEITPISSILHKNFKPNQKGHWVLKGTINDADAAEVLVNIYGRNNDINIAADMGMHLLGNIAHELTKAGYDLDNLIQVTNLARNTITSARRTFECFPEFDPNTSYSLRKEIAYAKDIDERMKDALLECAVEGDLSIREARAMCALQRAGEIDCTSEDIPEIKKKVIDEVESGSKSGSAVTYFIVNANKVKKVKTSKDKTIEDIKTESCTGDVIFNMKTLEII